MPIYEYECAHCKNVFEVFLTVNDQQVKKCPHCKSVKIKKLVSNCSFRLKGSGWYLTDYAHKDKGKNNGKQAKDSDARASSEKNETAAKSEKTASTKSEAGQAA